MAKPGKKSDAARYAALQKVARAVNHEVRLIAVPGRVRENGTLATIHPARYEPMTLGDAIDELDEYLGTAAARKRGDLEQKRNGAEIEVSVRRLLLRSAERDLAAVEAEIGADAGDGFPISSAGRQIAPTGDAEDDELDPRIDSAY